MTWSEEHEAEVLHGYWTAPAADDPTAPPPGLDPEIAALARYLTRGLRIPAPEPSLRRRAMAAPSSTASCSH